MKKIIFFHLYNDISGSPQVLSSVIRGIKSKGFDVELYTSHTDGFLSGIEGVKYHTFSYKWTTNRFLTFLRLIYAQLYMFIAACRYNRDEVVFYINTICPFAPALAGRLKNIPVVYHVHEVYVKPNLLHKVYFWMWKRLSYYTFFVSKYVQNQYDRESLQAKVIYNALSKDFLDKMIPKKEATEKRNILMISSLKEYKGLKQLVKLAEIMPEYRFRLIVNSDSRSIESFFETIPGNLIILPAQKNVHRYLIEADVLLNLTIPSLCIETFGLTILEAMAYGIPVICPPVGGPLELVDNGQNGFQIDSRNLDEMSNKIRYITNSNDYNRFSNNAKRKSECFNEEAMIALIEEQLKKLS